MNLAQQLESLVRVGLRFEDSELDHIARDCECVHEDVDSALFYSALASWFPACGCGRGGAGTR